MSTRVLVVDDERPIRAILATLLGESGYQVDEAASGEEALEAAARYRPDVVLLDLALPGLDGVATMERLRFVAPEAVTVIMTAHGTIRSAVDAMRRGAHDYLTKPFDNDELRLVVERAAQHQRLSRRVAALESQVEERFRPENIVGASGALDGILRTVAKVAPLDTTVLIQGESGTGKELIARAIHRKSKRADGPFVAVNCGAIPPNLVESEFFGHVRGAFTDAKSARRGVFEQAERGTLFLDEVGELPADAQVKLLRALQDGEIVPVGSEAPRHVNVRVIAATNHDLPEEVGLGRFREDLFWHLNVVSLQLPPLRARAEDVPALVDHSIGKHAERLGVGAKAMTPEALSVLMAHDWPGNIRELENVVESALALAEGETISVDDLPPRLRGRKGGPGTAARGKLMSAVAAAQRAVEARLIQDALKESGGNRTRAAELLGISRKTLFNKLQELGLNPDA